MKEKLFWKWKSDWSRLLQIFSSSEVVMTHLAISYSSKSHNSFLNAISYVYSRTYTTRTTGNKGKQPEKTGERKITGKITQSKNKTKYTDIETQHNIDFQLSLCRSNIEKKQLALPSIQCRIELICRVTSCFKCWLYVA